MLKLAIIPFKSIHPSVMAAISFEKKKEFQSFDLVHSMARRNFEYSSFNYIVLNWKPFPFRFSEVFTSLQVSEMASFFANGIEIPEITNTKKHSIPKKPNTFVRTKQFHGFRSG